MTDAREVLAEIQQRAEDADLLMYALKYRTAEEVVRADIPRLTSALSAVLDLHHRDEVGWCGHCFADWPCRTYVAITTALT